MTVMQEAIEDGRGQDLVAEDGAPLRHDLIGGDEQAASLVAAGDQVAPPVLTVPVIHLPAPDLSVYDALRAGAAA